MGFTTGGETGGYTLTDAKLSLGNPNSGAALGDIVVTLRASDTVNFGDGKGPVTSVAPATLSGDNPDTAGDYTYTCPPVGRLARCPCRPSRNQ